MFAGRAAQALDQEMAKNRPPAQFGRRPGALAVSGRRQDVQVGIVGFGKRFGQNLDEAIVENSRTPLRSNPATIEYQEFRGVSEPGFLFDRLEQLRQRIPGRVIDRIRIGQQQAGLAMLVDDPVSADVNDDRLARKRLAAGGDAVQDLFE